MLCTSLHFLVAFKHSYCLLVLAGHTLNTAWVLDIFTELTSGCRRLLVDSIHGWWHGQLIQQRCWHLPTSELSLDVLLMST